MKYTAYNPQTGQLLWNYFNYDSEPQSVINNTPVIEGDYTPGEFYWNNGNIVKIPEKPLNGFNEYIFDYSTKTWQLDTEATARIIRSMRDASLEIIDKVNPVWYNTLTDQQKTELTLYRQALLDVPQQSGFPSNVNWPIKPSWI